MTIYRYDKGEIKRTHIDKDGFLIADSIITRTGVFTYRNADGTTRKELRHPDDVFKQDSLKTLSMLPITLLHPSEKSVNSDNVSRLQKGYTGESITIQNSKYIRNKLKITAKDAIKAVKDGIQELSLGYKLALIKEDGVFENERYDYRQTEMSYNHLAIVPKGRAGKEARISLDSEDGVQCVTTTKKDCSGACSGNCSCSNAKDLNKNIDSINNKSTKTQKENRMIKVRIDGIDYEAAPEVINALTKANDRADKAEASLKTATDGKSTLEANLDEAKEKLKKAEEKNNDEAIQKAVTDRLTVVSQASPHLDEKELKIVHDMSDKDIKVAVIKKHFPEANLDGKDDMYIEARYDSAIEMNIDNGSSVAHQRKLLHADSQSKNENPKSQEKSRKDMMNDMVNRWKPESKK